MPKYLFFALSLAFTCSVHAAQIYDLGAETPDPLPTVVGLGSQPVYITNTASDAGSTGSADSMAVDAKSTLHVGYGPAAIAAGDVSVEITGSMTVAGTAHIGKSATTGSSGRPDGATATNITLDILESLAINGGSMNIHAGSGAASTAVTVGQGVSVNNGSLSLYGSAAGGGGGEGEGGGTGTGTASLTATTVSVNDGEIYIGGYGSVVTTSTAADYSVAVGNGGRIIVNSGLPAEATPPENPDDPPPEPVAGIPGLDVSQGGSGIRIGAYGILAAGTSGGTIAGQGGAATDPEDPAVEPAQNLVVEWFGVLDASAGSLSVTGLGVQLSGTYIAGYNTATMTVNKLTSADAAITVGQSGTIALSKELQRAMNKMDYHSVGDSTILSGSAITFVNGLPVIHSAMGNYYLAHDTTGTDGLEHVWIRRIENGVSGSGEAADRAVFSHNLGNVWNNKYFSSEFANAVYNVSASETPIEAEGSTGAFNQEVFDAFLAGPGASIGTRGIADSGVMEFYIGGNQYGPATIAMSTATDLSHAMYRRINQTTSEYYQFGSGSSTSAYAFYDPGEVYNNRFWAGGFGRKEEADLDYGIAGFTYKPTGVILGYDTLRGPFVLGGALAYGKGDYEDKAATANKSTIASYSGGVYGGVHYESGLIATGHASYTYTDNDMEDRRGGMKRTADYSADVWSLGARVAYETHPAERLTLTPSIGLVRTEVTTQAHTERLDGTGVMHIDKLRRRSTALPVDLAISWDVFCSGASILRLGANLGYAYEFENNGLTGDMEYYGLPGVGSIPVAERQPGRNRFNFGAGFFYSGSKFDLTGNYDYYSRSGEHANQVKGALGVKF